MAYRGTPPVHNTCPSTSVAVIFTENLGCRATCIKMAWTSNKQPYIVLGNEIGEVTFYAANQEHIARFQCSDVPSPVAAMDVGDLRHPRRRELLAILTNGLLVFIGFPYISDGKVEPPMLSFHQLLQENVQIMKVIDIDGDGIMELVTISASRKVTAYRYDEVGLLTLNSWEIPAHVTGVSFGISQSGSIFVSLAQAMQDFVIRINFTSADTITFPKTLLSDPSHFNIPSNPLDVSLLGTVVNTVLLIDDDYNSATELKNVGTNIVCITAVKLSWGYQLILTMDQCGLLLVYGWRENSVPQLHPLHRIQLIVEPVHLCATSDHEGNNLYLGITNIYATLAVYRISVNSFIGIRN